MTATLLEKQANLSLIGTNIARSDNLAAHPIPTYWQQFEYYFTVAYAAPESEGRVKTWMNMHFQVACFVCA